MVDDNPTRAYWDYTLKVNIPGTKKSTEIIFKDADGEFFDFQSGHKTETEKYVNESNVFVVVVDTPYLMDKDRSIADAANVVGSIDSFIKELSAAEGVKQVIFVPIKCERWIHEGRIDDVIGKVEEVYDATIEELKHRNDTEISIIPIQTAGNIDFYELRPSYVVYNQDNGMTKQEVCSKISDRLVVLKSGKNHLLKPGDIVREDAKAVFFGTDGKPMDIVDLPNGLNCVKTKMVLLNTSQRIVSNLLFILFALYSTNWRQSRRVVCWVGYQEYYLVLLLKQICRLLCTLCQIEALLKTVVMALRE